MVAADERAELVRFADEIGLFYADLGFTRIWGRVLGWLLVSEPDLQSAEDLATVLHASRGSISMTTRALVREGIVERQTMPGDRRTYYRIGPGAWTSVFEEQARIAGRLCDLAKRGLGLLAGEPAERRRRLEGMYDLTAFFEREAPALLVRWHREHPHDR